MKADVARTVKALAVLLLALLVLSVAVEGLYRPPEASVWHWLTSSPRAVLVNGLLVGLLGASVLALTGRVVFSGAVTGAVLTLLALTHASTLATLGRPLFPWELLLARQAANLWPYATVKFGVLPMLLGGVGLVLVLAASLRVGPRFAWRSRAVLAGAVAAICAWLLPHPGHSLRPLGITNKHWVQLENYRENGLPLAFVLNLPAANVRAPRGYSRERVEALLQRYPASPGTGETPDVVVVMSESFFDVTRLPGVRFEADPLPTLHRLQREAASGTLYPPAFGGGTANTEFEVLTGHATRWLPAGSVPYQQYVHRPLPALPRQFAERGYRTSAVHLFRRWFWDRDRVYPQLGFQRFISEDDVALEGGLFYPADTNLTRAVKAQLEASEQPQFVFAISVEAHGPFEAHRYPGEALRVEGPLDDAARGELGTYAEAIGHADRELGALLTFLEQRARPAVVVFFGDHLPSLTYTLRQTGVLPAPDALATLDVKRRAFLYEVPLVVWSSRHNEPRALGAFSTDYLGPVVLREAGAPVPPYARFLEATRARFPVVAPLLLANAAGEWLDEEPAELQQARDDWYLLEYDQLFGEDFAAATDATQ